LDAASLGSENLSVPKPEPEPLHLRRIDAARNMRRFYALSTQPTLFGEISLIRNWGRIGTSGKTMVQTFDSRAEAIEAFARLERVKRRRGYAAADGKLSKPDDFSGITPPVLPALSVPRPWCQTSKIETRRSSSHDNCQ
jgi:predicted DNA-binding WGR domain protein